MELELAGTSARAAAGLLRDLRGGRIIERDPFISLDFDGVGELIRIAAERGRQTRPELKLGICGEHGGDPASIHFCEDADLDYVSCSPFRVPIARLAAAQATLAAKRDEGRVASNVAFIPVRGSVGR